MKETKRKLPIQDSEEGGIKNKKQVTIYLQHDIIKKLQLISLLSG